MKVQGVMLGWGRNDKGYKWLDIEGLRLDAGKDGIADAALEALVGQEVVAVVQVQWTRTKDGNSWPRRRVLTVRPLE